MKEQQGFFVVEAKYYGPTNTKGSRVRCSVRNKKYWFDFDYSLSSDEVYLHPIRATMRRFRSDLSLDMRWANTDTGIIAIFK